MKPKLIALGALAAITVALLAWHPSNARHLECGGHAAALRAGNQSGGMAAALQMHPLPQGLAKATFAGGCFWCMVHPFDELKGVVKVTSGYAGGSTRDPTYEEVSSGSTGHRESVEVLYDPRQISYARLLDVFWHNVDPTNNNGQFCDGGSQYRSAIFYHDAEQKRLAEASKAALQKRMKVYTDILPAGDFYAAEEYHQDYYKKNPVRYRFYRLNCGRDYVLGRIWGR